CHAAGCGAPRPEAGVPITQCGPIQLSEPMTVGPTITAYGPMSLLSPSSTPSPLTAVGWIRFATSGPFGLRRHGPRPPPAAAPVRITRPRAGCGSTLTSPVAWPRLAPPAGAGGSQPYRTRSPAPASRQESTLGSAQDMIPITVVDVADAEPLVAEVLRSGVIAQGPMVKRFEELFARVSGTKHAVAVNSGTTALVASVQALGLRPGDEVVTTPFTFVATLNAILEAGATVRFADIKADDYTIDPDAVASAITDRTRVLMPVHLYGQTADMGKLAALAGEHGLHVIEDAAQAVGARFDGKPAGSFGIGCFSLYATKNVTTAEGGVVTTDDYKLA